MKIGDKVIWNDIAINDFDPEERVEQENRMYTIIDIKDDTALIADEYGEAEVFLDEFEVI